MFDSEFESSYCPEIIDERTEVELRSAFKAMADEMGHEQFHQFAIDTMLAMEPIIRRDCKPGEPALVMLDDYYADKRRKERGFE